MPANPTTVVLTNGPRNALYALARSVQTQGACSYVTYRMEPTSITTDTHSMMVTRAEARLSRVYAVAKNRLAMVSMKEHRNWCDMACFRSLSSLQKSPITEPIKRSIRKNTMSPAASGRARSTEEYILFYAVSMHLYHWPQVHTHKLAQTLPSWGLKGPKHLITIKHTLTPPPIFGTGTLFGSEGFNRD